ncbi:hypothetical protein TrLO_g2537 [Triparma laevis f. longispina]|uniref:Uncharacterized protein n=1 Tax=Triparma laevis f. longispina TaxID=1714387 RepID=A0A9W7DQD1_9STRA|nr:hypothetical protein TrLO_g2537 [Triparma laevis f. longispina]
MVNRSASSTRFSSGFTSARIDARVTRLNVLPSSKLRRGVPFPNVIRDFGRVFRVHPNSLDTEAKTALYESSVPTEDNKIDVFISHSWSSPGYQKYFSLLVHECGKASIFASCSAGVLTFFFQKFFYKLPFTVVKGAFDPIFQVHQESQPWEFLVSFIVGILTLLFYPVLQTNKLFFIDCMVIHQTDLDLKMAGIKALGGFVALSKDLYVMWDSEYFLRLWCVYELAVFKAIHPDEHNIRLLPLRQSVAIFLLIPLFFAGFLLYIVAFPLVAPIGIYTFYAAAFGASTLIYTGAAMVGYDFADQIIKLDEQLSNFEVSTAQCFAPEDREEILNKIRTMYTGGLEQFNLSVRNELRADVIKAVRHTPRTLLPYQTLLTGLIASFGFTIFGISWFRNSNTETFVCFTIYMISFSWVVMPTITSFSLYQGEALYKRKPPPQNEIGFKSALKRNKWSYLKIGVLGAFLFIGVWTSLAFVLPLATINSKTQPFLGVFPKSSAIYISLATCLPAIPIAYWTFEGTSSRTNHQVAPQTE